MKKKNIIIIIICITLLLLLLTGVFMVSYGYITSDIVDGNGKGKYYLVENLRIEYSDGSEELTTNQVGVFIPGSVITKKFSVKNTGNKDINYDILFTDIENTFNRKNDIVYELYLDESLLASGVFPNKEVSYIVGDVNLDGLIDEDDYIKLKAFFEGNGNLTHMQMIAADLNLDNVIDELDSHTILKEYINVLSSNDDGESINDSEIEEESNNSISSNVKIGTTKSTLNVATIVDNQVLLVNESAVFTLKIKYLTSEDNQIEDSGKNINAKISFEQSN